MVDRLDLQRISLALRRLGWGQSGFSCPWRWCCCSPPTVAWLPRRSRGLALTTLAFLVLLFSLWQCWSVVRCGRGLDSAGARPSKGETSRLLHRGLLASLLGLTLGIVGYQALAGSLFVQASLQAPGFFGGPVGPGAGGARLVNYPITSIEMLSVLSNTQVLTAHLAGLLIGPLSAASAPRRRPWATAHHGNWRSKDERQPLLHPQLSTARLNRGFLARIQP